VRLVVTGWKETRIHFVWHEGLLDKHRLPLAQSVRDARLFFSVRSHEMAFTFQLTDLNWDKLPSSDYIGDASFDAKAWLDRAMGDGLYADNPMWSSWWGYRLGRTFQ
jgi:hypothetical protein